ncbi:MAG TPA: RimK family alpha-L-glutamate ligase [Methanomicrobiales archaeon]|nr:RimK family alpha-L-glutamate ligase [Methanomicrobiales archaeon]
MCGVLTLGKLGIFVDRQTLSSSLQLSTILKCRDDAESLGHTVYFIFPVEVKKITGVDALFIRSRTDPMNISFVASKMAEYSGIPVIDDSKSIQICADKINMYLHLMKEKVALPATEFLSKDDITDARIQGLFEKYGAPLILKEPSTSFSARVERVATPDEFTRVARRFIKLSDWIVMQEYVKSTYDWRVGILNGELLYACKYIIPSETFKIQAQVNGHLVYCAVQSVPPEEVPKQVVDLALKATSAIGSGLYGVDIKEVEGRVCVIEVNDNPSLEGGEDRFYPDIYKRIISHLMDGGKRG